VKYSASSAKYELLLYQLDELISIIQTDQSPRATSRSVPMSANDRFTHVISYTQDLLGPNFPRLSPRHQQRQFPLPIFQTPKPLLTLPSIQITPIQRNSQSTHLFTVPIPNQPLLRCSIFNCPNLLPFICEGGFGSCIFVADYGRGFTGF
jgi:hypothetical protein